MCVCVFVCVCVCVCVAKKNYFKNNAQGVWFLFSLHRNTFPFFSIIQKPKKM